MFLIRQTILRFIALVLGIEESSSFPPPLSKSEEFELFKLMKSGDLKARSKLIEHNLRLVSHIIRKYYSSYDYPDELLSIGSLGLIKAVDSFKNDYGTRFATYGAKCVQNEILMFFRGSKKVANEISINETIDVDRDGNPLTYIDVIATEDNVEEELDLRAKATRIRRLVDTVLQERERQIITLRYGLGGIPPKTQREVAELLGISRSYVSRIEKGALDTLREYC